MKTTFTVHDSPELGIGGYRYELSCPHGTTRAVALPGPVTFTVAEAARLMILRHAVDRRCRCAEMLRERDREIQEAA